MSKSSEKHYWVSSALSKLCSASQAIDHWTAFFFRIWFFNLNNVFMTKKYFLCNNLLNYLLSIESYIKFDKAFSIAL